MVFAVPRCRYVSVFGLITTRNAEGLSCAIGAAYEGRYHQELITFPKSLADFFAAKSRVLLELELDSACVSSVQTLLLLSSHEAACGRDARMWLYSGKPVLLRRGWVS